MHNTPSAPHQVSSSSDEIDTSDDLINFVSPDHDAIIVGHPADIGEVATVSATRDATPQPLTSNGHRLSAYSDPVPQMAGEPTPIMTHAEQQIREAEASKAHLMDTLGKLATGNEPVSLSFIHSAFVDEEYLMMGSHVDEAMCKKIINHEYVDFSRLLPRDRLHCEDEPQRMELVNKDGMSFWSPVITRTIVRLLISPDGKQHLESIPTSTQNIFYTSLQNFSSIPM